MTLDEAIAVLNGDKELICFNPFLGGDMVPESISCRNKLAYDADCTAIDAMRDGRSVPSRDAGKQCASQKKDLSRKDSDGSRYLNDSQRIWKMYLCGLNISGMASSTDYIKQSALVVY